jgi:hypothetical protein
MSTPCGLVAWATVRASEAALFSFPATPVNVTVAVLDAAEDDAAKLTCTGVPGVRLKLAGVAVTPAGVPLTVTWID